MADLKKRITSLTEKTTLTSGDFIAVDNVSGGTKKYNYYADKTALNQAVSDIAEIKTEIAVLDDPEGMTVGNAEQLLSDVYTEDSEPYKYRASFSGDREFDEIVGGTVAWNQIVVNGNFASASGWGGDYATPTVSDNVLSISPTTADRTVFGVRGNNISTDKRVVGHKYLSVIDYKSTVACRCIYQTYGVGAYTDISANTWTRATLLFNLASVATGYTARINAVLSSGTFSTSDVVNIRNAQLFDLTQMFGSTIADYIYAQEQATAGAGVAIFRKLFGASYYPFNSGELISVSGLSAHIMRDANNNIIGNYPLDSSLTLRGIPKLADGKMYFDGDTYQSDGTVTRRYGVVDLGTLTWNYNSNWNGAGAFYCSNAPSGIKFPTADIIANAICAKYGVTSRQALYNNKPDKMFCVPPDGKVSIRDFSYTDAATFKTAMSGIYMVYELATATTETAEPYQNPQIVSEYGTEEYVSTTICPVGHVTKYPENLRKKIEGLPWDLSMIAPIENGTTASKAYSVGQYFLHNNVFCKAKTAIASGATFTLNTNYTETTVAAELYSALH